MIRKLMVDDRKSTISRNRKAAQAIDEKAVNIEFNGVTFVKEGADDWCMIRKPELEEILDEEVSSEFIRRRFDLSIGSTLRDLLIKIPDFAQINIKIKSGRNLFELTIDKETDNKFRLSEFNANYYIY